MFNQWVRGWAPCLVTGEAFQRVIQSRFTYVWSRQDACNQATAVPLNHYVSTKTEAPALVVHHTCRMLTNQVFLTSTKSPLMKLQFSRDLHTQVHPPTPGSAATAFPVSASLFATTATLSHPEEQKRHLNTVASHNSQDRVPPNRLCLPVHRDIACRNSQG